MTKEDLLYILDKETKTPTHMSKDSHHIHTPIELVQDMLNKIDPVFIHCGDVLVLYNLEFLMELATIGVDMTSVTFFSDDKFKTGAAKAMGVSVITELPMNKLFDVVIGNPPYDMPQEGTKTTKKIWPLITKTAISMVANGGYLVWVVPTGWLKSNNAATKSVRVALTSAMNTTLVDVTADNHFKQGIEIAGIIAKKEPYTGNTQVILADGTTQTYDITDGQAKSKEEIFVEALQTKIISSGPRLILDHTGTVEIDKANFSKVADADFKYECIYSTAQKGYSNKKLSNDGVLKIALNLSAAYYSAKAEDNNMPITTTAVGGLMYFLPVDSVADGEKYRKYFSSKVIRFLADTYKKANTGFCHIVTQNKIPQYDVLNGNLDDASLYSHFNLTADEIAYIENAVK